jgi:glycosyltransferase involved in cell wall biosynthesis
LMDKWWLLRPLEPLLTAIERAAVRRTHIALPVCEDLAARIRPWVGPNRVFVIPDVPVGDPPNAVGVESLRTHLRPNDVLGLYVGNLERYQGIDLMLEALARLAESCPFRMVVIGGSPGDIATYRNRAHDLALGERVKFIGPRPLKELNAYLSQADILVSPRIKGQNTPMKVYSYMQSGKAILATAIRSHTQVLDNECAELFTTKPKAMAEGIAFLTADPLRRRRLGEVARVRAERDYSHDAYCRRLAEAYAVLGE